MSSPCKLSAPCAHGELLAPTEWSGPSVGRVRMPASGAANPGPTSVDTVFLWTGGKCEVEMICNGLPRRWLRTSGMVDVWPAGTVIEHVSWNGDAMNCIWIDVDGALTPADGPAAAPQAGLVDRHIADIVWRLEQQAHGVDSLGRAYVDGLAATLTAYLRGKFCVAPSAGSSKPKGPLTRVQRESVRSYIDEHIERNVSVAEMAQASGYSANHFARLFKRSFGMSPYQYLIERRIQFARRLLLDPDRSIAEVATASGFATQAHLHGAFKRKLGVTPGEFRRSC
jgi:AraC family transcriptional regulator